jgi:hypothetical protein
MEKDVIEAGYWALFFGVFFAESIKNVAKGTANSLQENINSYLQSEILTLNLLADDSDEEFQRKLEAAPKAKENIISKLETNSELCDELETELQLKFSQITVNADKIAQLNINPTHVEQKIENF